MRRPSGEPRELRPKALRGLLNGGAGADGGARPVSRTRIGEIGVARDRQNLLRIEPQDLRGDLRKNGRRARPNVAETRLDPRRAVRLQPNARRRREASLTLAAIGHAAADPPMAVPTAPLRPRPPAEAARAYFISFSELLR